MLTLIFWGRIIDTVMPWQHPEGGFGGRLGEGPVKWRIYYRLMRRCMPLAIAEAGIRSIGGLLIGSRFISDGVDGKGQDV